MNQLAVTADLDDHAIGLKGNLVANGFTGFGEGWFNPNDVFEFCERLKALASTVDGKAELIGSQSKSDGSEYLERFGIRCYVISKTGILGVHVTLSEYPYTDCRVEEISKVSSELKVDIQLALEFAEGLRDLAMGDLKKVELVGRE
ncbi:MAG: hypothetical protein OEZ43_00005 [Gammaproteobacteria bacterium]|nr:hypothetical protein [Gammaproteobacteria bacterium]